VKKQSQEHAHHFASASRALLTKNSSCQAKQSIPNSTVTFCGDCVKMREDFASNFGDKKKLAVVSRQITFCTSFSTSNFFAEKQDDCFPLTSSYFFVIPLSKIKLKYRHFDTIEVTEAESQAVLNTLTEHDFQD
jgi:hypothetical protein